MCWCFTHWLGQPKSPSLKGSCFNWACTCTAVTNQWQVRQNNDTSRRGGAVVEFVLTCRRLAEWEQRHTVTCCWINTQTFVWGHYFCQKNLCPALCLCFCLSLLLTLSLPGNVLFNSQFSAHDYFSVSCPLSPLFSPSVLNIFHSLFFTYLAPTPTPIPLQAFAVCSFEVQPKHQMCWESGQMGGVERGEKHKQGKKKVHTCVET